MLTTFGLSFAFNNLIISKSDNDSKMKRVTSIGGISFKCKVPKLLREWYQTHLGLNTNQYGVVLEWRQANDQQKKDLLSGVQLLKRQNTLNLQQKIL